MTGPGSSPSTGPDLAALREWANRPLPPRGIRVGSLRREVRDLLSLVDDLRAENERLREIVEEAIYTAEVEGGRATANDWRRRALAGSPADTKEQTDG